MKHRVAPVVKFDPRVLHVLTPAERAELDALLAQDVPWRPLIGPQTAALESKADIVGFGGSAGGGKSDLGIGLALQHKRVLVLRREKDQTQGIIQRLADVIGTTDGYSTQGSRWRVPVGSKPLIEFGGLDNPGDERKWQGRPHDYLFCDEVTEMREAQVRFVLGWLRDKDPRARCRVLFTFNPPTTTEGRWVIEFFAPWLDPKHPNPAQPGELRWFTTIGGKDHEVPDGRRFVIVDDERVYDYDPMEFSPERIIKPKSRTFIPSRVTDNPHYMATDYISQLQAMPEPLRSQMLYGDFRAGMEDDAWQVIPTAHVEAAMERWSKPAKLEPMDSLGVDVAMGGRDNTVIARRHGMWFDEPIVHPGVDCVDGQTVAGFCLAAVRNGAPIHLDLFGVGAKPYGHLMELGIQVIGVNVGDPAPGVDTVSRRLRFKNIRSMLWWSMREALDPANNTGIALPPDRRLLSELTTVKWKKAGPVVQVESREEIIKDMRKSPDYASAYVLALLDTPKRQDVMEEHRRHTNRLYDPYGKLREARR